MRARSIPEYVYFYDSIRARFFYNIKNITRKSWRHDDGLTRRGGALWKGFTGLRTFARKYDFVCFI